MSGIEVAGLVLGGFPLLISAAENYKKGFEPLVKWKRFRTEFIQFIDAVDIQKQLFNLTIECLLRSAGVEEDELQLFMEDASYEGWRRPILVQRLRLRLGPALDVFLSTANTMNGLMLELQALLLIKDGQVEWAKDGASRWDYQLKRIHLSFSKKGTRTVDSLKSHNKALKELLDTTEKLGSMKAKRKDTTWANVFECIRRHASSLHAALRAGWSCQCTSHIASLRLEPRKIGGWDSNFNVAISSLAGAQNAVRREVVISVKREVKTVVLSSVTASKSNRLGESELGGTLRGLPQLRQNFETRSSTQVDVITRPILSTSISNPEPSPISSYTSFKSMFKNSSTNGSDCLTENGENSIHVLKSRLKIKKTVRICTPIDLPVLNPSIVSPTGLTQAPPTQITLISDLCDVIRCSHTAGVCLGLLSDGHENHELYTVANLDSGAKNNYISLADILSDRSRSRLSQRNLLQLANTLASSLLQLQTTPWLVQRFEKSNIFFMQDGDVIMFEQPYIRHTFGTVGANTAAILPSAAADPRFATRNSLSNLGILLLELCYGEAIEDQEDLRANYLGSDGRAHSGTDYLTARDWVELVWEQDPKLEPIIKACLFCMFEEKPDWTNKSFTQAVYTSVVEPLDSHFLSKWP